MKLSPWLTILGGVSAMSPMEKMQSVLAAHSKIRNAFNRPLFQQFRSEHEKLFEEAVSDGTRSDPEFFMERAHNLTTTFRTEAEGPKISQFPSLDGSGNDLTGHLRGKVGDKYSRLVPAEYCKFDGNGKPANNIKGEVRCINELSDEGSAPVLLPNERDISLLITETNSNNGDVTSDDENTMVGPLWGQFITHDIIQTPDMGNGEVPCDCSKIKECKNISVDKKSDPHFDDIDCMFIIRSAVHVPSQGQFVREQMNQKTSFIDLSQVYGSTERELAELISTNKMHLKTRDGIDGARGNVGKILPFTQDAKTDEFAAAFKQPTVFNDDNFKDFIAGDNRVEENPFLASFHTIFLRYHNMAVTELRKVRADWTNREVFENARLITMSVAKNIHYGQAIPAMIGDNMRFVQKLLFQDEKNTKTRKKTQERSARVLTQEDRDAGKRPWNEYQKRPNRKLYKLAFSSDDSLRFQTRQTEHMPPHETEPSIRNEFATAGYRMHGQVSALMKAFTETWKAIEHARADQIHSGKNEGLLDGEKKILSDNPGSSLMKYNFFDPEWVHRKGPGGCLRGAMKSAQLKMDGTFAKDLQHFLFKPSNWHHGVDLFAINIARGRDHAIGSYGALVDFCKDHRIYGKFYNGMDTDATLYHSVSQWTKIKDAYISKSDASKTGKRQDHYVDLYVGMQLERHMPGGTIGPTSGCIIAEQFVALKEGDRFWHENFGVFTVEQMNEIRKMGLGNVACKTFEGADGKPMPANSFMAKNPWKKSGTKSGDENTQQCKDFEQINFKMWENEDGEPEKEPVITACIFANRPKALDCSNLEWTKEDLEAYINSVKKTGKFPILGRKDVVTFIPISKVQRISLAGNRIDDLDAIVRLLEFAKDNLLEVSLAKNENLDTRAQSLDKFVNFPKLGHLDVGNSKIDCVPVSVLQSLSKNLKSTNPKIFLSGDEKISGSKRKNL